MCLSIVNKSRYIYMGSTRLYKLINILSLTFLSDPKCKRPPKYDSVLEQVLPYFTTFRYSPKRWCSHTHSTHGLSQVDKTLNTRRI